jgi:6-pyruvoyltetrahydropterin/6-carboxytetrahydropterin synthase
MDVRASDLTSRRPAHPAMEKIIVHSHFHTGHRQLGYPGKCKWVHGHTWRGTVTVSCEEFPRDELDMALDFGDLKAVMRFLDHKILVTEQDATFLDPELFEPEGVVVLKGKGPSVENVALYVWDNVVRHIAEKFPGRNVVYTVEVSIQETDNNIFVVCKNVTI